MIRSDINIEKFSSIVNLGNFEYAVATSVKSITPIMIFKTAMIIEPLK